MATDIMSKSELKYMDWLGENLYWLQNQFFESKLPELKEFCRTQYKKRGKQNGNIKSIQ